MRFRKYLVLGFGILGLVSLLGLCARLGFFMERTHSPAYTISWSPQGDTLAVAGSGSLFLFDNTLDKIATLALENRPLEVEIIRSPDGKKLLLGFDKTIQVGDVVTRQVSTVLGTQGYVSALAWSPDGSKIAGGATNNLIYVWDALTFELVNTLSGHDDPITSLIWHPDNSVLISGSTDTTIRFWDVNSGQSRNMLQSSASVFSMALSPDASYLASPASSGSLHIWNMSTNQLYVTLNATLPSSVSQVRWSSDGRYLVQTASTTIEVWDWATHQSMVIFEVHDREVTSVEWDPNSYKVASVDRDGFLVIWDTTTGQILNSVKLKGS